MAVKMLKPDVEEKYLLESTRCNKITNKITGHEFVRNLDKACRWDLIYTHAAKHPEEFECEFDRNPTWAESEGHRFSKEELEQMSMPQLRSIGKEYGIIANSLQVIRERIMKAQDKMTETA